MHPYICRARERQREMTYDGVEESGLADIREANDAGSKAHAYFGG
jgi:hypothetical protein